MANYANVMAEIVAAIYTNDNEEITGASLQAVLLDMVASLGSGYQFKGVALTTTNPGTPDQNVVYLAFTPGTYQYFGNASLSVGQVGVFYYNGTWTKKVETVIELVDNLTTGGHTKALTAEQGKVLAERIQQAERLFDSIIRGDGDSGNKFYISDENGFAVVEFSSGHIKTKNFNSANTVKAISLSNNVLNISF